MFALSSTVPHRTECIHRVHHERFPAPPFINRGKETHEPIIKNRPQSDIVYCVNLAPQSLSNNETVLNTQTEAQPSDIQYKQNDFVSFIQILIKSLWCMEKAHTLRVSPAASSKLPGHVGKWDVDYLYSRQWAFKNELSIRAVAYIQWKGLAKCLQTFTSNCIWRFF